MTDDEILEKIEIDGTLILSLWDYWYKKKDSGMWNYFVNLPENKRRILRVKGGCGEKGTCVNCRHKKNSCTEMPCYECSDHCYWEPVNKITTKHWQPSIGKPYWVIIVPSIGAIFARKREMWTNDDVEKNQFKLGLAFRTRKEAREKIKGIREVLKR